MCTGVCLYTLAHMCKSTCRCVWAIDVLYVPHQNLFMINWPRTKVLTTNLCLKSPLPILRALAPRNLSQTGSRLWEQRLRVGVERNVQFLLQRSWKILDPRFLSNAHRNPRTSQFNNPGENYNSSGYLHLLNPDYLPLNGAF